MEFKENKWKTIGHLWWFVAVVQQSQSIQVSSRNLSLLCWFVICTEPCQCQQRSVRGFSSSKWWWTLWWWCCPKWHRWQCSNRLLMRNRGMKGRWRRRRKRRRSRRSVVHYQRGDRWMCQVSRTRFPLRWPFCVKHLGVVCQRDANGLAKTWTLAWLMPWATLVSWPLCTCVPGWTRQLESMIFVPWCASYSVCLVVWWYNAFIMLMWIYAFTDIVSQFADRLRCDDIHTTLQLLNSGHEPGEDLLWQSTHRDNCEQVTFVSMWWCCPAASLSTWLGHPKWIWKYFVFWCILVSHYIAESKNHIGMWAVLHVALIRTIRGWRPDVSTGNGDVGQMHGLHLKTALQPPELVQADGTSVTVQPATEVAPVTRVQPAATFVQPGVVPAVTRVQPVQHALLSAATSVQPGVVPAVTPVQPVVPAATSVQPGDTCAACGACCDTCAAWSGAYCDTCAALGACCNICPAWSGACCDTCAACGACCDTYAASCLTWDSWHSSTSLHSCSSLSSCSWNTCSCCSVKGCCPPTSTWRCHVWSWEWRQPVVRCGRTCWKGARPMPHLLGEGLSGRVGDSPALCTCASQWVPVKVEGLTSGRHPSAPLPSQRSFTGRKDLLEESGTYTLQFGSSVAQTFASEFLRLRHVWVTFVSHLCQLPACSVLHYMENFCLPNLWQLLQVRFSTHVKHHVFDLIIGFLGKNSCPCRRNSGKSLILVFMNATRICKILDNIIPTPLASPEVGW